MILVGVNLLLYAANPRYPEHLQAKAWWESLLNGDEPVALNWQTISSFLRMSTHPRIFEHPLRQSAAVEFVDEWLVQPVVRVLEPSPRHWQMFRQLLLGVRPDPNLVTDAYLAALAIEYDCELNSTDGDFKEFPGLRWRNPLAASSPSAT